MQIVVDIWDVSSESPHSLSCRLQASIELLNTLIKYAIEITYRAPLLQLKKWIPDSKTCYCRIACRISFFKLVFGLMTCSTRLGDSGQLFHQTPLLGSLQQIWINILLYKFYVFQRASAIHIVGFYAPMLASWWRHLAFVTASSQIKSASSDSWASSS